MTKVSTAKNGDVECLGLHRAKETDCEVRRHPGAVPPHPQRSDKAVAAVALPPLAGGPGVDLLDFRGCRRGTPVIARQPLQLSLKRGRTSGSARACEALAEHELAGGVAVW